ncbi:acyl-ACP thioesterase [Malaciobacter molluscorum LMG 25693]|uniref:Acyl-ACP thioesterase n=1 Tax=Malaciobacter molluscorum LMG 25693 TaxID=870501 RepID=A0A2G1DI18_9BACT|nr:acyl-ACP thioesterase domain-containing protein [Malaciobacter molluscorum]AXX93017.1 acyl-ACP thioesterase [Malaciobacter molluscorum LMG 25693]PHO18074.1 acyl-ACP thioesterase [Malaciobacter molluscorum LMG 25693]RXJ94869.1 acyl-ACP thioesterase [Malaciobacter molluscorum]
MKNYFEKEFELRFFEMNRLGEASPIAILTLLQEAAAEHCDYAGHNLLSLMSENLGWVLLSGVMQMKRYPLYKEKIIIRTWISQYHNIRGFRENIIYDENYNIIGRARGLWLFYDIKKRRPKKIHPDFLKRWSFYNSISLEYSLTNKIEPLKSFEYQKEFKVNMYDTDTNKHVNNLRYLQWLMESIPDEIINNYYLYFIDGRFVSEAQYGDIILSSTKKDIDDNSFLHTIKVKGTNKVCATGKTIWRKINR